MWRNALPCRCRGINGRPQRELTLNSSPPLCLEDTGISISVDWVKPSRSHETQLLWPCFWSRQLTPFIVSSSGSDNSIKGFAGLYVHQIHKAPHGSTTEMSQKSMKSFPEGFLKDLSSKNSVCPCEASARGESRMLTAISTNNFYIELFQERYLRKLNYGCPTLSPMHSERPMWMSPDSHDI